MISGETRQPIAGASVIIGGVPHVTDGAGQLRLSERFAATVTLDIQAQGFLDRQTGLGESRTLLSIWPKESPVGLTEDATLQIVYAGDTLLPLARLPPGVTEAVIVLSPDVLADSVFVAAHEDAVARLNASLGGLVAYRLATQSPGADPRRQVITTRVDPSTPGCEDTFDAYASGPLLDAFVTYCHRVDQALIQHEVGHTFGFRHSTAISDVMHPSRRPADFSAREVLLASLMLQRNSGNRFPDFDRLGTAPLSAPNASEQFRCGDRHFP